MKDGCLCAVLLAAAITSGGAFAQRCSAVSGPQRAALVELYTSEGCSSCPPADRQLSLIGASANTNVIALALHVNFWDYIGWKDPFARAEFTERQRMLIAANGGRTLYTPHFFVNGQEIRDRSQVESAVRAQASRPAGAGIRLVAMRNAEGAIAITASAEGALSDSVAAPLVLYAAVTEDALVSRVRAGENGGATLSHDHVVRHWMGPVPLKTGTAMLAQTVTLTPDQAKKGVAVAAFVQDTRTGEVLQAASTGQCKLF
jgi:hypothetical protein